jgi:hypothetical protein
MGRTARSLLAAVLASVVGRAAAAHEAGGVGIGATAYGYVVPDQPNFVMLVVPADARWFHLEGRYNYESLHTGSMFVGFNAGAGDKLRLDVTGMVGGVFGDVDGVALGFRLTLAWRRLDLSTEGEFLIDLHHPDASFFYSWSELGVSPLGWLRLGAVVQRLKVVQTPLEVQRGLFVSVSFLRFLTATVYELNLGWTRPTFIGALGVRY